MLNNLFFCISLSLSFINILLSKFTPYTNICKELNELIFLFLSISLFSLIYSFITNDFNLQLIAYHSHSTLPLYYKVAALWSSHEGTIFLWSWILFFYVTIINNHDKYFIFLSNCLLTFFLSFTWLTSNPFNPYYYNPEGVIRNIICTYEGKDLNPLLQDPFLVIHPPILFLGYISCCIPFILTLTHQFNLRAYTLFTYLSWTLLTLGILLGSWWAYYELGWGGYWFWDPIENIALLPWIATLGLIHSIVLSRKINLISIWNILFTFLAFFFSLIGTFFVRSGLLSSVHSFIVDKTKGVSLITFTIILLVYSIYIIFKTPLIHKYSKFNLINLNNWLLLILFIFISITTFLPNLIFNKQISIGPDFYNTRLIPLICILLFLILAYHNNKHNIFKILGTTIIILPYLIWLDISFSSILLSYLSILLITSPIISSSHFLLGLLILAIILNKEYEIIKLINMIPGNNIMIDNYIISLLDINEFKGTNYITKYNKLAINYKDKLLGIGLPDIRYYIYQGILNNKSIALSNYITDIYINLKEGNEILIMRKPGMNIIWGIGIMIVIEGIRRIKKYKL